MPIEVIMPKLEMSQETAFIVEWLKNEGDLVKKGEPLLNVETDKVTIEIESPGDGILRDISAQAGDTVAVTTSIAKIFDPEEACLEIAAAAEEGISKDPSLIESSESSPETSATLATTTNKATKGSDLAGVVEKGQEKNEAISGDFGAVDKKRRASPAARRLSVEYGLSLDDIQGTGPNNRIQGHDVHQAAMETNKKPEQTAQGFSIIPLHGMRRTIADRMQASYQTAPHINFTTRVDISNLNELRLRLNEKSKKENLAHVSMTTVFVWIVAKVLENHPVINSSLMNDEIHLMNNINIGVAVALSDGLIVPVIQNADTKNIAELAKEMTAKIDKAHQKRLQPVDVSGGTFTISNLGSYGIEQFNAIINPGQAAILAIGASQPEVVALEGRMEIRPILRMTLSVDHRIIDGAVAAHFLKDLKSAMEYPFMIEK